MRFSYLFICTLLLGMGSVSAWLAWPQEMKGAERLELQRVSSLALVDDDHIRLELKGRGLDSESRLTLYPEFGNRQLIRARLPLFNQVQGMVGRGDHIFVANSTAGLVICDVSQPDQPVVLSSLKLPGMAWRICVLGDLAVVLTVKDGLHLVDISDPLTPALRRTLSLPGPLVDLVCNDRFVYVSAGLKGLYVFDFSDSAQPAFVKTIPIPGQSRGIALRGDHLAVAAGLQGVLLFHGANTGRLELEALREVEGKMDQVAFSSEKRVYATSRNRFYMVDFDVDTEYATLLGENSFSIYTLETVGDRVVLGTDQGLYLYASVADGLKTIGFLANSSVVSSVVFSHERAFFGDLLFGLQSFAIAGSFGTKDVLGYSFDGNISDFAVSDQRFLLAGAPTGLSLVERRVRGGYQLLGQLHDGSSVLSFTLSNERIFIGDMGGGLVVLKNNRGRFEVLNRIALPGEAVDIIGYEDFLLVADTVAGLLCFDISDPNHPVLISSLPSQGSPHSLLCVAGSVYMADSHGGLLVASLSESGQLSQLQTVPTPAGAREVVVMRDCVLVLLENGRLMQLQNEKGRLNPIGVLDVPDVIYSISANDDCLYAYSNVPEVLVLSPGQGQDTTLAIVDRLPVESSFGHVRIQDGLLHIAVPGDGIYIYSLENPEHPGLMDYVKSSRKTIDFLIDGEQFLALDNDRSISLFPMSDDGSSMEDFWGDRGLVVDYFGKFATLGTRDRLQIVDLSNPARLKIVGSLKVSGSVSDIKIRDLTCYVTVRGQGFMIVDVSDPNSPHVLGQIDIPGSALAVDLKKDIALIASDNGGLVAVDISNSSEPVILDTLILASPLNKFSSFRDVQISGDYVFVADLRNGLVVARVTDQGSLSIVSHMKTPGYTKTLFLHHDSIYLADSQEGIVVIDVKNPHRPQLLCHIEGARSVGKLWVDDDEILALAGRSSLYTIPVPMQGTDIALQDGGFSVDFPLPDKVGYYSVRAAGRNDYDELIGQIFVNEQGVVTLH